jgi:hypothetical protein
VHLSCLYISHVSYLYFAAVSECVTLYGSVVGTLDNSMTVGSFFLCVGWRLGGGGGAVAAFAGRAVVCNS